MSLLSFSPQINTFARTSFIFFIYIKWQTEAFGAIFTKLFNYLFNYVLKYQNFRDRCRDTYPPVKKYRVKTQITAPQFDPGKIQFILNKQTRRGMRPDLTYLPQDLANSQQIRRDVD